MVFVFLFSISLVSAADFDGDGIEDTIDNCRWVFNPNQEDYDYDGVGNACDNCITESNPDQNDSDKVCIWSPQSDICYWQYDGYGDVCDNCPYVLNPSQADADNDGIGDACDVSGNATNMIIILTKTPSQPVIGDRIDIDVFAYDPLGISLIEIWVNGMRTRRCYRANNCSYTTPPMIAPTTDIGSRAFNGAGESGFEGILPDDAYIIPPEFFDDDDGDGIENIFDNCIDVENPGQDDYDNDGVGDDCDLCDAYMACGFIPHVPVSPEYFNCNNGPLSFYDGEMYYYEHAYDLVNKSGCGCYKDDGEDVSRRGRINYESVEKIILRFMGEEVCRSSSNCESGIQDSCFNSTHVREYSCDEDGVESEIIKCPIGACLNGACDRDRDGDGIVDRLDNCPNDENAGQEDVDGDDKGDVCDNCPDDFNPRQEDGDRDGAGNVCDNCPIPIANPGQEDSDGDGRGDECDCTDGVRAGEEIERDCGGSYCPQCGNCETGAKWAPDDTPCTEHWPTNQGPVIGMNTEDDSCAIVEVCHQDLDYIVEDALDCCQHANYEEALSGDREDGKESACSYARQKSNINNSYNSVNFKKCLGLYAVQTFGRSAVYMQGYFHGEFCCYDDDDICPSGCEHFEVDPAAWEIGTNATGCSNKTVGSAMPDFDMGGHRCEYSCFFGCWGETGYWSSDSDYRRNSDSLTDVPAHASINLLSTGTCVDYSFALTTILRKIGFSQDDALSVNGERHGYNLVRFPGETKWHYVDTVGNNGGGVYGGVGFADPDKWGCEGNFMECSDLNQTQCGLVNGCDWDGDCEEHDCADLNQTECDADNGCAWADECVPNMNCDVFPDEASCEAVDDCSWKLQTWYDYCRNMDDGCSNDFYSQRRGNCPSNDEIYGCEGV